ncbi:MAG: hypothetical protein JO227_03810 [Acetobacteraceae bacterium]|nr:hypothetical protein [Acetobacteraceae bacterium]
MLFPGQQGGAKAPGYLVAQVKRALCDGTGFEKAHGFRHLSAMLFSRERSGEQPDALRRYDAVLARYRR